MPSSDPAGPRPGPPVARVLPSGEKAIDGVKHFTSDLISFQAKAVLIQEGVNDINGEGASAIAPAIAAIQTMIRSAKSQHVTAFVGTLLPQVAGLPRAVAVNLVQPFNNQLMPMATSEGAIVVDGLASVGAPPSSN